MRNSFLSAARVISLLAVAPLLPAMSHAQVFFEITPASQVGSVGETRIYSLLVRNDAADAVTFLGFSDGLTAPGITTSLSPSLLAILADPDNFLDPGESLTIPAFLVDIGASALPGTESTFATLLYDSVGDPVGGIESTADWSIRITGSAAVAPEPGTLALFVLGATSAGARLRRRAKNGKP